jgi:adenine-specific DNA-methyltransferase
LAAINDLIEQIDDLRLRERLSKEVEELTKHQGFGLRFERHLPELTPIFSAKPRRGDSVCLKNGSFTDVWRVTTASNGHIECVKPQTNEKRNFSSDDLLVVRQFGESIFPSLIPMGKIQNGDPTSGWHTLIEADNYHALQLLEYLYCGQVDCIYIDPPYNTGARDWKYNNDYVDGNDTWRHSKWLSFMEKRLRLAQELLNPTTGVLIVTIDEHELHHLGMLLEQLFPNMYRQMVTIVTTPGGVTQGRFSRVEEHALYCFNPEAFTALSQDDLLSTENGKKSTTTADVWQSLIRRGVGSERKDRPGMFFPIKIDSATRRILGAGNPLPLEKSPDWGPAVARKVAWPVRSDGQLGRWRVGPTTFNKLLEKGYVKLGGYDEKRRTWTVLYLQRKAIAEIENGTLLVVSQDPVTNAVVLRQDPASEQLKPIKTVWNRSTHHAGSHGSTLLRNILGGSSRFSFPKSIYATRDALAAIVRNRPNALILDFFAGSGTTLNAVNLMNASDGGKRRCVLVTNNELSGEDADTLRQAGDRAGTATWEQHGICRFVTWPRSKNTILGKQDDGSKVPGDYLTSRLIEKSRDRRFVHVGFLDRDILNTSAKQKQFLNCIGLPQTLITRNYEDDLVPFIFSDDKAATVLFDPNAAEDWLSALDEHDETETLYILSPKRRVFDALKQKVTDRIGQLSSLEEEKRPISSGFLANLEYFKLEFLDKDHVALKRRFKEILPLLWLKAGAIGVRPELPERASEPEIFNPTGTSFAVLLDEKRFSQFLKALRGRNELTHVFIVTDADDAFKEMAADVSELIRSVTIVQLYRDYLENFMINRELQA